MGYSVTVKGVEVRVDTIAELQALLNEVASPVEAPPPPQVEEAPTEAKASPVAPAVVEDLVADGSAADCVAPSSVVALLRARLASIRFRQKAGAPSISYRVAHLLLDNPGKTYHFAELLTIFDGVTPAGLSQAVTRLRYEGIAEMVGRSRCRLATGDGGDDGKPDRDPRSEAIPDTSTTGPAPTTTSDSAGVPHAAARRPTALESDEEVVATVLGSEPERIFSHALLCAYLGKGRRVEREVLDHMVAAGRAERVEEGYRHKAAPQPPPAVPSEPEHGRAFRKAVTEMVMVARARQRGAAIEQTRVTAKEPKPPKEPKPSREPKPPRESKPPKPPKEPTVATAPISVLKRQKRITAEEEKTLATRWFEGGDERALKALVSANIGLVCVIAQRYSNSGATMEDLISEGNVGLCMAARKFNPSRGVRFATYASYWVAACMLEFIVRSHGPVRIGTTRNSRKVFFGLGRAQRQLAAIGLDSDRDHLAAAIGVPVEALDEMMPRLARADVALDAPKSTEDGRANADVLADESALSIEDSFAENETMEVRREAIRRALAHLDPRERFVLKSRYLLTKPRTLNLLGARLGISRERVRQLEVRALHKIRKLCRDGVAAEDIAEDVAEDDAA